MNENVPQGTLFDIETTNPEPKEKEPKATTKRTWLNCDIKSMTKREFISFCRKEYNRIHHIEEKSSLHKTTKQLAEEFLKTAREKCKDNKGHVNSFLYYQEAKRMYSKIQAAAIRLATNKSEKELTEKEKDSVKPTLNKLHKIVTAFLTENQEANNNWKEQKENYDEQDCLCVKSLKQYIKTCYESMGEEAPEEYTLRTITALLKKILPTKYILNKNRSKTYYSKTIIKQLINEIKSVSQ